MKKSEQKLLQKLSKCQNFERVEILELKITYKNYFKNQNI